MKRQERLMRTLRGESVDRPPVSFYELNGLDENFEDNSPFNIYSHPSWKPLIDLTREKTDRIVMRPIPYKLSKNDPIEALTEEKTVFEDNYKLTTKTIRINNKTLTSQVKRFHDINTDWTIEHLLKNTDDLNTYLELPVPEPVIEVDVSSVLKAEEQLGDSGIVMIDTSDPLCLAASLFDMGEYTITALTEPDLFKALLDRFAAVLQPAVEAVSKALPGRLWRIYGPEFASPPYLPPYLFDDYVCSYVKPMVDSIKRYGGYARIHSHGNLKDILDSIHGMGVDAIDPIEPPPQGDVELSYVREKYGKDWVLFGNLELRDVENVPTDGFAETVKKSIEEGTRGNGRGFVLMPSACPYGRNLSSLSIKNYEKMIEIIESL